MKGSWLAYKYINIYIYTHKIYIEYYRIIKVDMKETHTHTEQVLNYDTIHPKLVLVIAADTYAQLVFLV